MPIRKVHISRFRGIKELDWDVNGDVICLVGPGDSTKSTILDAIGFALYPRYDFSFDDTDFYDAVTTEPIEITVTVGQIPKELMSDSKFGFDVRGWHKTKGLHDEPQDGDELVLSIRLVVESSLEPSWSVINERNMPDGRPISYRDRQMLGTHRLGEWIDRHLSWSKGSLLSQFSSTPDELPGMLAKVVRAARGSLQTENLDALKEAASKVQKIVAEIGVAPTTSFKPGLDIHSINIGTSGITLHDGDVPIRRSGLGTRRLLAIALQHELSDKGGIALIDEIEHGLEPHRIKRLIQVLQPNTAPPASEQAMSVGQVIMTTHSPVVICSLKVSELRIVRSSGGITNVLQLENNLQNVVRKVPEAFLGQKIIVCEGKTELGICMSIDTWWADTKGKKSFSYLGIVPVEGGGSKAPNIAYDLAKLGYKVAFLGDSDRAISPDKSEMEQVGICVILWDGDLSIEQRLVLDLPWDGVQEIMRIAVEEWGRESICTVVANELRIKIEELSAKEESVELRKAFGEAAKGTSNRKGWFKRIDLGEKLGSVIIKHLDSIPQTDLSRKLLSLREWIDRDG